MTREPDEKPAGLALAAVGAVLGILLTVLATGLQGGSLVAYQRQATALESIAVSLQRAAPTPTSTIVDVPADGTLDVPGDATNPIAPIASYEESPAIVFEDSTGSDRCSIVEDGNTVRIEGPDPEPCELFLWTRFGEPAFVPNL